MTKDLDRTRSEITREDGTTFRNGDRVRIVSRNVVGTFGWAYKNPVRRSATHDRAAVMVGDATWSANLDTLTHA